MPYFGRATGKFGKVGVMETVKWLTKNLISKIKVLII
jgi:hypothetical protein